MKCFFAAKSARKAAKIRAIQSINVKIASGYATW
jgi:hypothetical protein